MKKLIATVKGWFKSRPKKSKAETVFSTIGYSYVMEMKRNRDFRRKMEKTNFGKATKKYLIENFGPDAETETK